MNASAYVGRVGGLAVALGVGVAVVTGYGGAQAWADSPGTSSSATPSAGSGDAVDPAPTNDDETQADPEVAADPDPEPELAADPEPELAADPEPELDVVEPDDPTVIEEEIEQIGDDGEPAPVVDETSIEPEPNPVEDSTHTGDQLPESTEPEQASAQTTGVDATEIRVDFDEQDAQAETDTLSLSFVARTMSTSAPEAATTTFAPPTFPSLRLWPTAFDPATAAGIAPDPIP